MDFKFKEKHYKKGRFNESKNLSVSFSSKKSIDLTEVKSRAIEYVQLNTELTRDLNIKIPEKNEVTAIRTQRQLNNFQLILNFIEHFGAIDFLSIQTYTIDKKFIEAIQLLLDGGKIKKLVLILSETISFRMPKIYELIKDSFAKRTDCNLAFYWVHSKIILIKCGNRKFNIDGSGNFSSNAQIEHYNIFSSPELFDFDINWQDNFFFGEKLRKNHEIFKNFEYAGGKE